mmetsp:Transcript_23478/g.73635  ORF Transcript_23478/g.73635 Transcript_23478/m.73635 type:complete len:321 (-) Transcript_23478:147-1109(-)|eukprot:CAMPEP_0118867682 /NCGR_PEP_ID=MMETSP1163-20130328/11201_1 /TAXON_ID=124430 /ORGANISM="Phaeomonas parva, Strain CCMP2877" /LENGTH=320 /DNA_ID=CAMNT_0006802125 /DNA_START=51 /DNA_END=1013 /DNA_ORIENTATION=+
MGFRTALGLLLLGSGCTATLNGWTTRRSQGSAALAVRGGDFGFNNLFGSGDKSSDDLEAGLSASTDNLFGNSDGDDKAPGNGSTYEGLSQEEIYGLLRGVPVFTVTDEEGKALVILTADNEKAINYFMDPVTAMMVKDRLQGNATDITLQVRGRALIEAVQLRKESDKITMAESTDEAFPNIHIYPSPQDLSFAAQLEKNATAENRLNLNNTAIPVFTCPSMVISPDGEEPVRPWFFSLRHLMETFKKANGGDDSDAVVHMSSLDGLMRLMEKESEFNWRRTLFIPSPQAMAAISEGAEGAEGGEGGEAAASADKKKGKK